MKIPLATLAIVGYANAGAPHLSISIRDGDFDGLGDGLDPTLSWESSSYAGEVDLAYGFKASAHPTTDIASLPRSIWGKASSDIAGWDFAAKAEVLGTDFYNPNVELDIGHDDYNVKLHLVATVGRNMYLRLVQATKGFDVAAANGRVTITPRYNLVDDQRDVILHYSSAGDGRKTNVTLTASLEHAQQITVSQQINADHRIAPTITSDGDMSLEWERRLSADSFVTANLRPNEALDVRWKDAAWTASINMPMEGTTIHGANVHIQREVQF